mgnify:CR=1 FL=1
MGDHLLVCPLDQCDPVEVGGSGSGPARPVPGYVVFVGAGLGGPLQLTLAGLRTIEEADVIVLAPSVDAALLDEPEVSLKPTAGVFAAGPEPDFAVISQLANQGLLVAWLLAGDPLVDGEAGPLAAELVARQVRIDMVPGLSRAGMAATSAGVLFGNATWLVLPGAEIPPGNRESLLALVEPGQIGVLAERARAAGRDLREPVLVTINYASSAQRSIETTLDELDKVAGAFDGGRAAVVIGAAARREPALNWFESKPLFGWQVLVPRTKGLSGAMERRLEQYGAFPVQVPTISVEPPRNPQPMERAIQGLVDGRYQWIIFNSANAVRAVTERLAAFGLDARAFSGLRIAAVGVQTVQALRSWGIIPDLVPEAEQRSEALAAGFPARDELLDPIDRIFIPRADIAVDSLAAALHELGWQVDDAIAYRTVRAAPPPAEIREGIKAGRFDAVVFSSASTVRNMVGIAGKPHPETIVAAIGPATMASCAEHGLRVDVVSDHPGTVELVDALAHFAVQRRAGQIARGEPVRRPSQHRTRCRGQ